MKKENFKKGISLIVLVITIIVIIILAGAVILSLANNNPIAQANEATFKASSSEYVSELAMTISSKYVQDFTFDPKALYAPSWDGVSATTGTVKEFVPSMTKEDAANYVIAQGKLCYIGTDTTKIQWTKATDVTSGLVLHLDAGNVNSYPGSGTTWFDLSGNGNNGTLNNGPTYNASNNGSIVFDGVNDYATVPNSTSLWSSNNFTMIIWAKSVGNGSAAPRAIILSKDHSYIDYNNGGNTMTSFYTTPDGQYLTYGNTPPSLNTWRQYVYSYDGSKVRIYENGVLTGSRDAKYTIKKTTNSLTIGMFDEGSYHLNGNISVVQVYNRAITDLEVTRNFTDLRSRYGL